jgi:hypothetical protein
MKHWSSLPRSLAELLEKFLHPRLMALTARLEEENPRRRYPSERLPPG